MTTILAYDIGGTTIKCGLFDQAGTLLKQWSLKTNRKAQGSGILKDLATDIKAHVKPADLIGIGIGVPGPVLGTTVSKAVNLGWQNVDVKAELERLLGFNTTIFVENDADVAAYGEFAMHQSSMRSMALLTLGTGIGGGIILNGDILRGTHGVGGEVGHFVMGEGLACNCGQNGCLETFSSATGVSRHTEKFINEGVPSTLKPDQLNAKLIFEAAKQGDQAALKSVDQAAVYLAQAIGYVNTALDLERVLIGGGLAEAGDFLLDKIRTHYRHHVFPLIKDLPIEKATLGNDAGIYGCAWVVKQHG